MMTRERNLRDSLLNTLESLLADEFDRFKHRLSYIDYDGRENIPRCQLEEANTRFKLVDLLCTFYCEDGAVNVAICVLTQINRRDAAAKLTEKALGPSQTPGTSAEDYRVKYRKHIQKKYRLIKDRNARLGDNVNLNSRYTKLIIVNKYRHEKEREHEIMAVGWRHAEIMSEQAHSSITIDTLFKPDEDGQTPQIVVLLGAAGIGKTMTARKIMLDWAAGRLSGV
ncbi:galanin peptide [Platysternon megacephalum]|uniref:Galanin peptide n=1 Tax=Platysternon megacephalum TaxID=55544 RepID=A0A4D9DKD1_9SAUR|nr:galanin peptide [Platysternon megacephalum]